MLKFVVISDLHIVPEGQLTHSIDTAARLAEAVDHINEEHPDAEFCIAAGDLADRGETAAYRRLRSEFERLTIPLHLTLGNHDCRENFLKVFSDAPAASTGFVDLCIDRQGHRVLVMDSLDTGRHAGLLVPAQLDWLAEKLAEAESRPVILALHHNIADLNVSTDGIKLDRNASLAEVLRRHPDVRHVISGHVHLTSSGVYRGLSFTTLAGCSYNIAPRKHDPQSRAPRREGPGQYAVVWSGGDSTVVLQEDFHNRHAVMPRELFL